MDLMNLSMKAIAKLHFSLRFSLGVVLAIAAALCLPSPSFSQSTYGLPPNVYATAATGLGITYSSGVIQQGGAVNTIVPGTLTATNTMASCAAPAYTGCNFIYWTSGTGLSITTTFATANATGNVVVAYATAAGGNITAITYAQGMNGNPGFGAGITTAYWCGATSGSVVCPNTATGGTARVIGGIATLAANTAVISAIAPAFTSTSSYSCVANDLTTRANPVQVANTSTSSITITNTTGATDVINWVCVGF